LLPGEKQTIVWKNAPKPIKVFLLQSKKKVAFTYENGVLQVSLPDALRTNQVDVVKLIIQE
jgi:hypothetical protein